MSPKILLIKVGDFSFVRQDEASLRKRYRVQAFTFGNARGMRHLMRQLQLLGWLLRHVWGARCISCWFSDYHALLPTFFARAFRKPLILFVGGYDAAKLPEYNYGAHRKRLWSRVIQHNCRRAACILPLSQFLADKLMESVGTDIAPRIQVAHLGCPSPEVFLPTHPKPPTPSVICVTGGDSMTRVRIKGMDFYKSLASACPEISFTLVGATGAAKAWLEEEKPPNLTLVEFVQREALIELYSQAQVVALFSRYEGFGMVMLEGMLCECYPLTMAGIGTAEIVETGGLGLLVETHQVEAAQSQLHRALELAPGLGAKAREVAMQQFSTEKREQIMFNCFEQAMNPA